jgi:tRNA(fMet)-specific endonuclease VapC
MPYIIDADWIIQALKGQQQAVGILEQLAGDASYVSWATVAEVYEVAFKSPDPHAYLAYLREFLLPYRMIGLDESIAERFAEIRSLLRRQGQLISDFDILLAATALQLDLTVLTYNSRHFERIPDLRIYRAG